MNTCFDTDGKLDENMFEKDLTSFNVLEIWNSFTFEENRFHLIKSIICMSRIYFCIKSIIKCVIS